MQRGHNSLPSPLFPPSFHAEIGATTRATDHVFLPFPLLSFFLPPCDLQEVGEMAILSLRSYYSFLPFFFLHGSEYAKERGLDPKKRLPSTLLFPPFFSFAEKLDMGGCVDPTSFPPFLFSSFFLPDRGRLDDEERSEFTAPCGVPFSLFSSPSLLPLFFSFFLV